MKKRKIKQVKVGDYIIKKSDESMVVMRGAEPRVVENKLEFHDDAGLVAVFTDPIDFYKVCDE